MKIFKKLFLKPLPSRHGEINYHWIDRFTVVHFLIGTCYGLFQFGFGLTVSLAIIWELIENPLKAHFPKIFPHGTADQIRNAIGDCIAVIMGWVIIRYCL